MKLHDSQSRTSPTPATTPSATRSHLLLVFVCCLLLLSAACSHSRRGVRVAGTEKTPSVVVDIFSAKTFLTGSDYERFSLIDGEMLWRECGTVETEKSPRTSFSNMDGDNIFPYDPTLQIEQRRVEALTSAQKEHFKNISAELLRLIEQNEKTVPPPGSIFSLREPGLFELAVSAQGQSQRVVTSVDALSNQQSPLLNHTRELYSLLRGVGPVMCEAKTFYGIGRGSL